SSKKTSAPKPPPSTTPSVTTTAAKATTVAQQILALVNEQRATAGCGALTADDRLDSAAQKFSEDMANRDYFAHTTPEGVTFDQRITAAGYPSPAAENIAKGSTTAAQTMTMWMNSDGHRRNILNCAYKKLGVGLDKSGWYWVQDFGF
ncbi:CAP domain-containing protein, partial [Amycolatopsis pithecellobii]